jgi:hypothetical protein
MTEQHHNRQTMERLHQHLARADRELQDAQHILDPGSDEKSEEDMVHAVASARLAVTTALDRVRDRLGVPRSNTPGPQKGSQRPWWRRKNSAGPQTTTERPWWRFWG